MRTHHSTRPTCQFGTLERSRSSSPRAGVRRARPPPPDARSGSRPAPAPGPGSAPIPCGPGWPRPDGPRPRRGPARRRAAGAHAPPSSAPTTSSQRVKTASMRAGVGGAPEAGQQPGHRVADRPGPLAARALPLIGPAGSRPGVIRATTIPSGSGAAVVRIDWPAGSSATRARLRAGSSSENTSSRSSVGTSGVRARTSSCTPRRSARARQRCSPCEAWVRASRPSICEHEVVAVGPHGVHAPPQVVRAAGRQRVEQVARPSSGRSAGAPAHALARPGQAAVGRRRPGARGRPPAARAPPRGPCRRRPAAGPTRRGSPSTSSLARPPDWRSRAARWRRTRSVSSAARAPSGSSTRQGVVEQVAPAPRPAADDGQVLGGEDRAGRGGGQLLPAGDRLAVHPGAAAAGRQDLRLDQGRAVRAVDLGPDDGARSAPVRTMASGGAPRKERRVPR